MEKIRTYRVLLVLGASLLVLLPLLAALQYHWLAQLSRSETVRMQTNLDAALRHMSNDIRREVFQAIRMFFLRSVEGKVEAGSELTFRFEQWQSMAPYPDLLKAVYWVDVAEAGETSRIAKLVLARRALEPIAWPAELARWQQSFFRPDEPSPSPAEPVADLDARAIPPVFQIPVSDAPDGQRAESRRELFISGPPRIDQVILLVFDQEVITETLLPALVQTYFDHDDRLDYDILLVEAKRPSTILYRSSAGLTSADFTHPDAVAYLGLSDRRGRGENPDSVQSWFAPFADRPGFWDRMSRDRADSSDDAAGERSLAGRRLEARPGPDKNLPFLQWKLLARHKDGSLEQAVVQARLRNLAISLGVLLLLGGAISLIVFYARQMQQLANQQMAFVAGVSHELRTPIAVMHSAGENLQDGLIDDPEEARDYGALIVRESRRLLAMVEQVLAFSGIAFGQKPFVNEEVQMERVLAKAVDVVRPVLDEKGIVLEEQIAPNLPAVRGDAEALTAAVQNLLQNAIKYGEQRRWIGLEAHQVGQDQDAQILVSVSDRGEGIASGEQVRIFEPFYRASTAVKAGIRGNGLGLSIVKNIVEAHGGQVKVDSLPGEGSRFTIRLKTVATGNKPIREHSAVV